MAKYINVDEFSKRPQHISGARLDCLDYSVRSIITLLNMAEAADVEKNRTRALGWRSFLSSYQ